MAEIVTYTDAVATLRQWVEALNRCSAGQSYSIEGTTLTRQDIPEIRAEIQRWHNTVTTMEAHRAGRSRPLGARPVFPAPGSARQAGIYPQELWTDGRT